MKDFQYHLHLNHQLLVEYQRGLLLFQFHHLLMLLS
tara:strand:- start:212 stop:319 length:108 start_codon:yes stop_codon:yes gene_type:complete